MARPNQSATRLGASLRADARASAGQGLTRRAAALAAILLAACGAPTPPPEAPSVAPAPPAASPAVPPQAGPAKPEPPLSPLDRYKRAVAHAILQANAPSTFEGVPPHFLRAVIVLQLTIDSRGAVVGVKTLRTRDTALAAAAAKSVRTAAPLPAPPRELLRGGRLELAETWLYRDDGKFQVRSVAAPQAAVLD
jgi:protein TonB